MDDIDNRAIWDRKYQEGLPALAKPDPFFISAYERLVDQAFPNAGTALDLASGLGRHALWLAERAWQVSAVDVSEIAIGRLSQTAAQLNVNIKLFAVDAAEYDFETARFDLIVLFYHLDRTLFPKVVSALNPGGLFICKMAVHWGSEIALPGGNFKPLGKNELASLVPGLQAVDCHERPVRNRGVVEFVGKKPLPLLTD
jgi:SAM-dependent methyltransferase